MKHALFSILYNEYGHLKQKLPIFYDIFDQIIFYDLNVGGPKTIGKFTFSTDGSHEYIKNYPDPKHILNDYGADAMRFYLMNSPVVEAQDFRFTEG